MPDQPGIGARILLASMFASLLVGALVTYIVTGSSTTTGNGNNSIVIDLDADIPLAGKKANPVDIVPCTLVYDEEQSYVHVKFVIINNMQHAVRFKLFDLNSFADDLYLGPTEANSHRMWEFMGFTGPSPASREGVFQPNTATFFIARLPMVDQCRIAPIISRLMHDNLTKKGAVSGVGDNDWHWSLNVVADGYYNSGGTSKPVTVRHKYTGQAKIRMLK